MADIQLHELWNGEDRTDIGVVETMTCVDLDSSFSCKTCSLDQSRKLGFTGFTRCLCIGSSMEFHDGSSNRSRSGNLIWFGINKEADADARIAHDFQGWLQGVPMNDAVEPSLGRHLLPTLWDKADVSRQNLQGNGHDLGGIPHLEVELRADRFFQTEDIAVDDMTAVQTQMGGDSNSPSPLGGQSRFDRIRFDVNRASVFRVAGLSHGGDMVDINAEQSSHGS